MSKDEILGQALALPIKDRVELALSLLRSLAGSDAQDLAPGEWEAAWAEEILRRSDEVHSGEVELLDWHVAIADIR
jgi:hypothetical protein